MSSNNSKFEFYKRICVEKNFFADKAWETLKFHTILSSSLISITIGTLVLMQTSETFHKLNLVMRGGLTLSLIFLPVIMFFIIRTGSKNFERECRRMYEILAILIKLEEDFHFRERRPIKEDDLLKSAFSKEAEYIPERWKGTWGTTKEFIDRMIKCEKDSLYGIMNRIFLIFKVVSIIMIIAIIIIACIVTFLVL